MASVTIRNIEPEIKRKLQMRAVRNGRSMEQELRIVLTSLVASESPAQRTEAEAKVIYDRIRALALPPLEPFDQKAFSDELNDFVP